MLARLAGREHRVVSGLALLAGGRELVGHAETVVRFRPLDRGRDRHVRRRRRVAGPGRRVRHPGPRRGPRDRRRRRLPQRRRPAGGAARRRRLAELGYRIPCRETAEARGRLTPHVWMAAGIRRPGHGRGSRDGQHARVRAWPRDRALRAVRGGHRPANGRGARRRRRGQAHARPHPRHHRRHPPAQGRRDRRLRRDGGDAPALHPEGAPEPLGAPARRRLRARPA